jgi:hypothetical protein
MERLMRVYQRIRKINSLRNQVAKRVRQKKATVSLRLKLAHLLHQHLRWEIKQDRRAHPS